MIRPLRWKTIDIYKRKLFLKIEIRRMMLKYISLNSYLPQTHRYYALYQKSRLTRIALRIQFKNKCVLTGRIWAVNRFSEYSRFVFQRESYKGHLPGFKRASW